MGNDLLKRYNQPYKEEQRFFRNNDILRRPLREFEATLNPKPILSRYAYSGDDPLRCINPIGNKGDSDSWSSSLMNFSHRSDSGSGHWERGGGKVPSSDSDSGHLEKNGDKVPISPPQKYQFPWQWFAGLSASAAAEVFYSDFFQTWMGKDFKFRTTIGRKSNGNQHTGGKYKFGKATSNVFKKINWGIGLYNMYDLENQHNDGKIDDYQFVSEETSNAVSTFGGVIGMAWGIGWELGRAITYAEWYQKQKFEFWYNQNVKHWGAPSEYNRILWDEWLERMFKYHYKSF